MNRQLALHTKVANRNMMAMTSDMGKLARKTKTETVSMKIITLVTLVFLPGTFVAVGYLFSFYCFGYSAGYLCYDVRSLQCTCFHITRYNYLFQLSLDFVGVSLKVLC